MANKLINGPICQPSKPSPVKTLLSLNLSILDSGSIQYRVSPKNLCIGSDKVQGGHQNGDYFAISQPPTFLTFLTDKPL